MRLVIQRVSHASVSISGAEHSAIGAGLLVFLGITHGDTADDLEWLCTKLLSMRIFADNEGKMNLDVMQAGGDVLVVSQFTLHASTRKGNRPSFVASAPPAIAQPLYASFVARVSKLMQKPCHSGVFGADMQVRPVNNGPVTILVDSRNRE